MKLKNEGSGLSKNLHHLSHSVDHSFEINPDEEKVNVQSNSHNVNFISKLSSLNKKLFEKSNKK